MDCVSYADSLSVVGELLQFTRCRPRAELNVVGYFDIYAVLKAVPDRAIIIDIL